MRRTVFSLKKTGSHESTSAHKTSRNSHETGNLKLVLISIEEREFPYGPLRRSCDNLAVENLPILSFFKLTSTVSFNDPQKRDSVRPIAQRVVAKQSPRREAFTVRAS